MSTWTMILCEGAHDRATIASLALKYAGWTNLSSVPKLLPSEISAVYPKPNTDAKTGAVIYQRLPRYLKRNDNVLEVRPLGGVAEVLGKTAARLLKQCQPDAVGVVVDANDKGVASRVEAFRNRFGELMPYKNARDAEAGRVVEAGGHKIGIWVAPDNEHNGTMDELLVKAATQSQGNLMSRVDQFASSMAEIAGNDWDKKRDKAILGTVHQGVLAGASLASGLDKSHCWFDQTPIEVSPFKELLAFIEDLTAP